MWRSAACLIALLAPLSGVAAEVPAQDAWAEARTHFERVMADLTSGVEGALVTSKHRTDADQARLLEEGYKPHPRSQHKLGLAWDVAAPLETLVALRDLAQAQGFTALIMTSPVTGNAYLHVQRYRRSPVQEPPAPVVVATTTTAIAPPPEPPAPAIEPPRPVEGTRLSLPRRLLRKKADGRIVLLLQVSEEGRVLDVAVDSSDLPEFDTFVTDEVRRWSFHPPTRAGQPVLATARLPIPIRVE
jgi:TonB family protein